MQFNRREQHLPVQLLVLGILVLLGADSARASARPWLDDAEATRSPHYAKAVSSPVTPTDQSTATNRDDFDVLHYELLIIPDFATASLSAAVSIEFASTIDGLDYIDLDLTQALQTSLVLDLSGILVFEHADDVLRIHLRNPLMTGESVRVTVSYAGTPEPAGFLGFAFGLTPAGNPLLATLSQPYGARSWWPCKDTPTDKATVLLRIDVPAGMYAASNGLLIEQTPTTNGTMFTWEENYPICTYNVSLAVAEYVSWQETWVSPEGRRLDIEYNVFPEHEQAARYDFGRTREIFDYYALLFGEYPFANEKYGMSEFVWEGAMEHQTMTSYGDFFITGDRFYERIIGHELAHHWWGNSMTLASWSDLWIHEGFATLAEALWVEQADGTEAYRTFLRKRSNACCGFPGAISPPSELFNSTVFNKAVWMLHMLRGLLGDNDFFAAVRALAERPELQYGSIITEDVISEFETTTQRPLRWFFDQWLQRVGRPVYDVDWTSTPDGDHTRVDFTITQSPNDAPWLFPLDLRIVTPLGDVDVQTFVASAVHNLTVMVDGDVSSVLIDPNEWLLDFDDQTATAAPRVTNLAPRLLSNWPNPFNPRTVLRFELPSPGIVQLRILDARGRVVDILRPGHLGEGEHSMPWNGTDIDGRSVASGIYRVLLEADGMTAPARPITLVR